MSAPLRLHPVDLGDLPPTIRLNAALAALPLEPRTIANHWRERYSSWVRRDKSGLFVLIKEADTWLDERGLQLLSPRLLKEKRNRNPGWVPAGDRLTPDVLAALFESRVDCDCIGGPGSANSPGVHLVSSSGRAA